MVMQPVSFLSRQQLTPAVRTYRHILLAMMLVSVINGMLYPILALYMFSISEDYLQVGLMMALPFLAAVPMAFVWGMLSDRIGSRSRVMALAGAAGGALFFAMPFLGPGPLIGLRLVQVGLTTSFVLLNAVATECFPRRKGRSVGDLNLMGAVGQMAGALAAGLLLPSRMMEVGSGAVQNVFFMAGIITICAALSLLPMRERAARSPPAGFREMLDFGDRRGMAAVSAVSLLLPLAGYLVFSVFPVYLKGLAIPWDATLVAGMFTALSALTGIFAAGLAGRACDSWGRRGVLVSSGFAYAAVWALMGMTRDPLWTAALWAVPVWSFFYVSATAMASDLTSREERGRGIGLVNSSVNLGGALGSISAGYLLASGTVENTFFAAALVALLGATVALAARGASGPQRG
jgi:MFS family permease